LTNACDIDFPADLVFNNDYPMAEYFGVENLYDTNIMQKLILLGI
jgi:hypothetical protein